MLEALFTGSALANYAKNFVQGIEDEVVSSLAYIGEKFVNDARSIDTYKDRTGNLRSSIGYVVAINGEILKQFIKTANKDEGGTGKKEAKEFVEDLLAHELKGIPGYILIAFAGMHYAAAVESLEFDVITGSTPTATQIGKDLSYLLS